MPSLIGTCYAKFGWCPQKDCSLLKGSGRGVNKRERGVRNGGQRSGARGNFSQGKLYCMREELLKSGGKNIILNHSNNSGHLVDFVTGLD